ncbi:hypothetical protein HNY73_003299 [Argiope bruennichi]|uniref:Protein quiver n=1 Tax=Argiope bruennichi TaxID=94029 RepID=A0A8T0FWE5_ARGBR|nr:hypothetical protein HNY73_003299 [Argiope bruennichi]
MSVIILLLCSSFFISGEAIRCYQCSSDQEAKEDDNCGDGRWRTVERRCAQISERGINWGCDWGYKENGVYWEECYCAEDGCNSGGVLRTSLFLILMMPLIHPENQSYHTFEGDSRVYCLNSLAKISGLLAASTMSFDSPSILAAFKANFQLTVELPTFDCELGDPKEFFMEDVLYPATKRKKNNPIGSETEFIFNESGAIVKQLKKVSNIEVKKKSPVLDSSPSETTAALSFEQWLASVTERINQTMHYQFNGFPDPLVFHVPQVFFDILHKRLSVGAKKKRLPNSVVGFCTKDSLPLGVFSKYTWVFTNVLHVKRIFDTPQVADPKGLKFYT